MSFKRIVTGLILILLISLLYYLFRPLNHIPPPADFDCLDMKDGRYVSRDEIPGPKNIFGMGLTYRQHLVETAAEYDPSVPPPIFIKNLHTLTDDHTKVKIPSREEMINAAAEIEKEAADKLREDFEFLSPLMDYEVELGFILLDTITANDLENDTYIPPIGFFIANDLSARSVGLLGEGTTLRYDYWGLSKSFPGFLPVSEKIWIPNNPTPKSIPCIQLKTIVNQKIRQSQNANNMLYTPLEMLRFIHKKYPNISLSEGDIVLTGTPGGVAIATPRALVRLSNLLGLDRFQKLAVKMNGDLSDFLKSGDVVKIQGEGFDDVDVEMIE